MRDTRIAHVAFTGSVPVGHAVSRAAAEQVYFCGAGAGRQRPGLCAGRCGYRALPLKTWWMEHFSIPANPVAELNGYTCTRAVFDDFVSPAPCEVTNQYRLGNPTDPAINLGPVVSAKAAAFIRGQVAEAVGPGRATH